MKNEKALLNSESVPVISFAGFQNGSPTLQKRIAKAIGEACERVGFFYLSDHGVPQEKIDRMFLSAEEFFALPESVKLDPRLRSTPNWNRGYQPMAAKQFEGATSPDLNEAFKFQRELPEGDPDLRAGDRVHRANKWPDTVAAPVQWRNGLLDYFSEMEHLNTQLLSAFAIALDLPASYFHAFYRKPITQIILLHYPPQESPRETDYGLRPHTDATSFTILAQDEVGGIQVRSGERWIDAKPIHGTFLINIGDMMARWTNDKFASTMHRVYNRTGRERYSAPFFAIPDFDAMIECLPSCLGPGEAPKYPPLHVGRSLQNRFASNWAPSKADVPSKSFQGSEGPTES
jgi:isopenicillin N synthase-like dioxygenase